MKRLALLLILITACSSEPIEKDPYAQCTPAIIDISAITPINGMIEGDILPLNYKGVAVNTKVWTKGIVPYYFQDRSVSQSYQVTMGFDEVERAIIQAHLEDMSEKTGIIFIRYEGRAALEREHSNGIKFQPSISNGSYIGMTGGIQDIKLNYGLKKQVVQHEMMHALGVCHEFTRSDRDEYIDIDFSNMMEHFHRQFAINPLSIDCGEFDINSIMMYPPYLLSLDKSKPIISLKDGSTYEMATEMSVGDILTVQALYKEEFKKR
jgi:hypothetical protein